MRLQGSRILVTGCAGFIGSHMVDALLAKGCEVVGVDNLSAGKKEFMDRAQATGRFQFHQADLLSGRLKEHLDGVDVVFHFAANPDVRQGPNNTRVHMEQNIEATYLVLEAMRAASVRSICFPSTSTVYGEPGQIPTEEGYGPLIPISIYGASKLACEALICSYAHTFDMDAAIYRFANVVGSRSTHNVLHDFIRKLREGPKRLEILGAAPGTNKSYVHVSDCTEAMMVGAERAQEQVAIYNIGSLDRLNVQGIADIVIEEMGLHDVRYDWTGGVKGGRGWVGDVKEMLLDIKKLQAIGWNPRMGSEAAMRQAVREILAASKAH
jgi:UDP-glucose 4-epimerase